MEAVNCTDSELCTYLQALEEESQPICSLDTSQSGPLKSIPIASKSYQDGKKTVVFHGFQSLMTLPLSTEGGSGDSSTLSPAGSPSLAKTSAALAEEKVSPGNDPVFGEKWRESSVKYDLGTSSWKTHRCLFQEDLQPYSVILPKWGMMRNGVVYRHRTAERPIKGTVSGLWPTPRTTGLDGGSNSRKAAKKRGRWPTPTKSDGMGGAGRGKNRQGGDNLRTAVGGQLNPEFVEWLMGWPIGFTSLGELGITSMEVWRYANVKKRSRGKIMRNLWWSHDPATVVKRKTRLDIQEAQILLIEMLRKHTYGEDTEAKHRAQESAKGIPRDNVSTLPSGEQANDSSPYRSQHIKQRSDEYRNPVSEMSQQRTRKAQTTAEELPMLRQFVPASEGNYAAMWGEIMRIGMGSPISRVKVGVKDRMSRIKALGNGQVPIVAATAWKILTGEE